MEEVWKSIKGYEGTYEVSNLGQVRSVSRRFLDKSGKSRCNPSVIMKQDEVGRVILQQNNYSRSIPVRSLVAEAFLNEPFGEDITHLNGDITDARAENLIATRKFRVMDPDWRDIPGYEGSYQASRYGQIRSLDRYIITQGNLKFLHGTVRVLTEDAGGYLQVALYKDGKNCTLGAHVFIARAWIPNYYNKRTVNHIDGDKHNNCIENLEWATYAEQQKHALETGLRKKSYWDVNKHGPVGGEWNEGRQVPVRCIETGEVYPSYSEAGRAVGQSASEIKRSAEMHCTCAKMHFVRADEPDYPIGVADLDGEDWKDIPGYEGFYQLSTKGRVKSLARSTTYMNGRTRSVPEKILADTNRYTFNVNGTESHILKKDLQNLVFPKKSKLFKLD